MTTLTSYRERSNDILMVRLMGAPARSAAAWLSAVLKAERDGSPCPTWDELERIAPSLPMESVATGGDTMTEPRDPELDDSPKSEPAPTGPEDPQPEPDPDTDDPA